MILPGTINVEPRGFGQASYSTFKMNSAGALPVSYNFCEEFLTYPPVGLINPSEEFQLVIIRSVASDQNQVAEFVGN